MMKDKAYEKERGRNEFRELGLAVALMLLLLVTVI